MVRKRQKIQGQEGKRQSDSHWGPYPDFWATSTINKHKSPYIWVFAEEAAADKIFFFKLRVISGGHPERTIPMIRTPTRLHPLPTVAVEELGVGGGRVWKTTKYWPQKAAMYRK